MPRTVGTPARSEFSSCTGSGDDLSGSWWARVVSAEAWKEGDLRSNAAHGGDTGAIRAWKEGDLRSNAAHGGDTGAIGDLGSARAQGQETTYPVDGGQGW